MSSNTDKIGYCQKREEKDILAIFRVLIQWTVVKIKMNNAFRIQCSEVYKTAVKHVESEETIFLMHYQ